MDIPTFSCTHWALGSEMIAYVDCDKNYPDHSDLLGPVLIVQGRAHWPLLEDWDRGQARSALRTATRTQASPSGPPAKMTPQATGLTRRGPERAACRGCR